MTYTETTMNIRCNQFANFNASKQVDAVMINVFLVPSKTGPNCKVYLDHLGMGVAVVRS